LCYLYVLSSSRYIPKKCGLSLLFYSINWLRAFVLQLTYITKFLSYEVRLTDTIILEAHPPSQPTMYQLLNMKLIFLSWWLICSTLPVPVLGRRTSTTSSSTLESRSSSAKEQFSGLLRYFGQLKRISFIRGGLIFVENYLLRIMFLLLLSLNFNFLRIAFML